MIFMFLILRCNNDRSDCTELNNVSNHLLTIRNQTKMDMKIFSIEELLQTPICMMNGEQFAFLMNNLSLYCNKNNVKDELSKPKRLTYGIKGIAETFGCSVPTANRIKKSGIIDDAISQIGRKIVVDVDKALELAAENKNSIL